VGVEGQVALQMDLRSARGVRRRLGRETKRRSRARNPSETSCDMVVVPVSSIPSRTRKPRCPEDLMPI